MKKVITDEEKIIDELLSRSVKNILPNREELKQKLLSGERLRIYIGTDATGTSLHLGHSTNYIILEKFRRLGHEVIFLIGDFTSRIGDPSDKLATRVQLSREQVVDNVKNWLNQVRPIIDIENKDNPVRVLYNHEWLSKLSFEDVIDLSSNFTVQQMIERDMFQKRINEGKPIYLHEFLYPLMQGYDSVVMDVDMEVCGNDQTFNALTGRTLLKKIKNKDKFVFVTTLLENPKTGEKMMSKSLGTGVYLDSAPSMMFGAIMAQPDENMKQLFIDCTYLSLEEISKIDLSNPKEAKLKLALEITKLYHGDKKALEAKENWEKTFSKKEIPENIREIKAQKDSLLVDVLLQGSVLSSKGEWRRLVEQNAIHSLEEDSRVADPNIKIGKDLTLKIGKKNFIKIKI